MRTTAKVQLTLTLIGDVADGRGAWAEDSMQATDTGISWNRQGHKFRCILPRSGFCPCTGQALLDSSRTLLFTAEAHHGFMPNCMQRLQNRQMMQFRDLSGYDTSSAFRS